MLRLWDTQPSKYSGHCLVRYYVTFEPADTYANMIVWGFRKFWQKTKDKTANSICSVILKVCSRNVGIFVPNRVVVSTNTLCLYNSSKFTLEFLPKFPGSTTSVSTPTQEITSCVAGLLSWQIVKFQISSSRRPWSPSKLRYFSFLARYSLYKGLTFTSLGSTVHQVVSFPWPGQWRRGLLVVRSAAWSVIYDDLCGPGPACHDGRALADVLQTAVLMAREQGRRREACRALSPGHGVQSVYWPTASRRSGPGSGVVGSQY